MDPKGRRRGEELETAILDAAWQQLVENGYPEFTFEAIAARAGTSRPVLYRRWADRAELMAATIRHANSLNPIELPDTGDLRDDVVALIRRFSDARAGYVAVLGVHLTAYFQESGTTLEELREMLRRGPRSGMGQLLDRAGERGEVDPSRVPDRVTELPITLARNELLLTLKPVPLRVIEEIVDEIWMPLLRAHGALREAPPVVE